MLSEFATVRLYEILAQSGSFKFWHSQVVSDFGIVVSSWDSQVVSNFGSQVVSDFGSQVV